MGRYIEFDKEAVLHRAMLVFWKKGYEAASIPDLLEAMDISRSSLSASTSKVELIKVGDIIGDLPVTTYQISHYPENNEIMSLYIGFNGKLKLSGKFIYYSIDDEVYGNEIMVTYEQDKDFPGNYIMDSYHLVRPERKLMLVFNKESDKMQFGQPGTDGEVELLIQNYMFQYTQSDVIDTAEFD
ncbi:hypothetical protein [Paenibacillus kobensis]|uniref:hypothetical protein n=1 Tax=Paenibacillus kobensis TaxID=59841 RepID=UPI000FD8587A|nr:hypothetical protein [Paenibacillus kobensis]